MSIVYAITEVNNRCQKKDNQQETVLETSLFLKTSTCKDMMPQH